MRPDRRLGVPDNPTGWAGERTQNILICAPRRSGNPLFVVPAPVHLGIPGQSARQLKAGPWPPYSDGTGGRLGRYLALCPVRQDVIFRGTPGRDGGTVVSLLPLAVGQRREA